MPTGKAIVHWIGCINAIKLYNLERHCRYYNEEAVIIKIAHVRSSSGTWYFVTLVRNKLTTDHANYLCVDNLYV